MNEKGCVHCSNSFINGIPPMFDGSAVTIGESDPLEPESMMMSAAGLNRPAPVTMEVWKHSEQYRRNIRTVIFVPRYCPFCGRKITENFPYLIKKAQEDIVNAVKRVGLAATEMSKALKKLSEALKRGEEWKPTPKMIAEGNCQGQCSRCKRITQCWKKEEK